jgi:hypothetical protein
MSLPEVSEGLSNWQLAKNRKNILNLMRYQAARIKTDMEPSQ